MITLYNSNFSCSFAIHIILELLNADYKVENVAIWSDEFKKINPRWSVPALIDSTNWIWTMTHVVAIIKYLLKKYPNNLWANWDIISEYELDQMLSFLNSDFHPSFWWFFVPQKFTSINEENIINDIKKSSIKRITLNLEYLEQKLNWWEYLVLNKLTVADIYAFVMLRWAWFALWEDFKKFENLNNFMEKISNIPEVKKISIIHSNK